LVKEVIADHPSSSEANMNCNTTSNKDKHNLTSMDYCNKEEETPEATIDKDLVSKIST